MADEHRYIKEFTLTRVLDAPRERVWEAWTDQKQVAQWWGPHGFTNPVCEVDARVGGALVIHMSGFGMLAPMRGVFQEVVKPERLVFLNQAFLKLPMEGTPDIEAITTVTFEDLGGRTRVSVHEAIVRATPEAAQALEGAEPGFSQQLEKLDAFLKKG